MKYLILLSAMLLSGCQSTPTLCDTNPASAYCDASQYHDTTTVALKAFDGFKKKKAFAIGRTKDGWEYYGSSYGYKSQEKAQARALDECQRRMEHHGSGEKCQLIR